MCSTHRGRNIASRHLISRDRAGCHNVEGTNRLTYLRTRLPGTLKLMLDMITGYARNQRDRLSARIAGELPAAPRRARDEIGVDRFA